MRIIVFSDSHGNAPVLKKIVLAQPKAEMFIFLGDGEKEYSCLAEAFSDKVFRGVRGNCDYASRLPQVDMLDVCGKRILFTHGHIFHVKRDITSLTETARAMKTDIVLYGHTHLAETAYKDGIYVMNPGSPSEPRGGRASYGFIDINGANIFTRIVAL